jgi:hypothetical protein
MKIDEVRELLLEDIGNPGVSDVIQKRAEFTLALLKEHEAPSSCDTWQPCGGTCPLHRARAAAERLLEEL